MKKLSEIFLENKKSFGCFETPEEIKEVEKALDKFEEENGKCPDFEFCIRPLKTKNPTNILLWSDIEIFTEYNKATHEEVEYFKKLCEVMKHEQEQARLRRCRRSFYAQLTEAIENLPILFKGPAQKLMKEKFSFVWDLVKKEFRGNQLF